MKFIFPQNYDFKNKILGIIDYSTAFVNLFWYVIVFILVNLFLLFNKYFSKNNLFYFLNTLHFYILYF